MTFSIITFLLIAVASFIFGYATYKFAYLLSSTPKERQYDKSGQKYSVNVNLHCQLAGLFCACVALFLYFDTIRISQMAQ